MDNIAPHPEILQPCFKCGNPGLVTCDTLGIVQSPRSDLFVLCRDCYIIWYLKSGLRVDEFINSNIEIEIDSDIELFQ